MNRVVTVKETESNVKTSRTRHDLAKNQGTKVRDSSHETRLPKEWLEAIHNLEAVEKFLLTRNTGRRPHKIQIKGFQYNDREAS